MTTRLRTNFVQGTITDNPLTIGATTINGAAFANLPVVVAPDFLVVEIDPLRQVGTPEIVYVTAHAANDTAVTVLRGQEGTTARAHNFGERWVHGATNGDFWGGGQQWYGRQQIDGPIEVLNDLNVIPVGNALQLAGQVTAFAPATVNNAVAFLNNGGAALYDPGEGAVELKATTGTDPLMYYEMPTRATAFPVVAGRRYWAMGRARPTNGAPARSIRCYINFYDNTGTLITPNSSTDTVEVTGGAWVIATHAATAPAGAVYATIAFQAVSAATNETHAFTAFGFGSGTTAPAAFIPPYILRLSDLTKRDTEYTHTGLLDVETSGYGDLESRLTRYTDVAWSKAYWMVRRAHGTKAAPTDVAAGDYIGGIRSAAWKNSRWQGAGDIIYLVDTTDSTQISGRLLLKANNLGSSTSYGIEIYGSTGIVTIIENTKLGFGSQTRQMIDLWSTSYGIGVQPGTLYFRTGSGVSFFRGGVHVDSGNAPGTGGALVGYFDGSNNFYVVHPSTGWSSVGLEAANARVYTRADISGMVGYDSGGTVRYLTGLRSDVTGNTSDYVVYTYGGAIRMFVGGTEAFKIDTNGFPWLRPQQWSSLNGYFQNSWAQYDASWDPPRFCKDAEGWVHLNGLIAGGPLTSGTIMFQLPAGFRPQNNKLFICPTSGPSQLGAYRVDVNTDGTVVVREPLVAGNNGFLGIAGITFPVH